jgi:rhomboid protease GluP
VSQLTPPEPPIVSDPAYRPQLPTNPLNRVSAPYVTYVLMAFTIGVYLLQVATQYLLGTDIPAALGVKVNSLIIQGQYWRLITPVFLHASLLHIGFNMYALYVIGIPLERAYGHGRYVVLYFIGAFAGNVFSFLFQPANSLGASTAIFGLLAAEGVLLYQNRAIIRNAQGMLQNVIVLAIINFAIGLSGGIDNWGHLGGFLGGLGFSWFAGPRLALNPLNGYPYDTTVQRDVIIATVVILVSLIILTLIGLSRPAVGG